MNSAKLNEEIITQISDISTDNQISPQILFQKTVNCFILTVLSKIDDYNKALQTIQTNLPSNDNSHFIMESQLDIQNKEMIRSIGCLLLYISTLLTKDHFQGDDCNCSLSIHSFKPLHLTDYMMIDRVFLL